MKSKGFRIRSLNIRSVPVGQERVLGRNGKLKKGSKIRSKRQRRSSNFGRPFKDWDRADLERVLGPNLDVDTVLQMEERQEARQSVSKIKKIRIRRQKISYKDKRRRVLQSWEENRQQILRAFICNEFMADDTTCYVDGCESLASHRCLECGTDAFFCTLHVKTKHQDIFHMPEIWQVSNTDNYRFLTSLF